ncbi:MAG: RNA pyrophosphohydrolase [Pseudomonadota bacterium]
MKNVSRSRPGRGYRPCVGVAVFSKDGRVFLGKRASKGVVPQYSWQMPQGGIDNGEDPLAAAKRELYEETRICSVSLLGELEGWLHYELPRDLAAWRGRYRGQAQRWFAFRFEGDESEIDVVHPPDGHSQEFSQWRWERLGAVSDLVVPFKRAVYEHVVEGFAQFAPLAPGEEALKKARPEAM